MPSNNKRPELQAFANNLREALDRWKAQGHEDGKRRTRADFMEELRKHPGCESITPQAVTNWLQARSYPRHNIAAICSVLNITEEELNRLSLTQEDNTSAGLPDRDTLERDYGLSSEFLAWFMKVNTGNLFQVQGYIDLRDDQYKRILPPLPFNDTEDLIEDIQLTRLRAYTSADFKALGAMERRMIEFLRLLIGEHNDDQRAELESINHIYKKGKTPKLPPDNELIKKEYQDKTKEIQEVLKHHGKHKKGK